MLTLPDISRLTLGELLHWQARRQPGRLFLVQGEQRLTYAEVDHQVSALAAGLRRLGLQAGDRLAIMLPNTPAFVVTVFAAARAGLIFTPVNVRRKSEEVLARFKRTRPAAVIAAPEYWPLLDEVRAALGELKIIEADPLSAVWPELWAGPDELPPLPAPDQPAAILYTLGSGGAPRGVTLTHASLLRNAADIAALLQAGPEDVFLGAVPFSNAFGLTPTILACALAGARLAPLASYHPGQALTVIQTEQVSLHPGTPTMFALEMNHPDFRPERCLSLRLALMSGAACPPELVARVRDQMRCAVSLAYGLTEASPGVSMTRLDDGPVTASQTVGHALPGVELKVTGPDGASVPAGVEGELWVRGYNVMPGYWDDPAATAQVLTADGWLRTGDLAVLDPDGPLRLLGRRDDMLNRGGFKIYPGAVEMVLRAYPGVKEAAVIGVPDVLFGELPCACVTRAAGADFSAEQLLAYAGEHLSDYAVPARVLFFDALPRYPSGPVRKDVLRARARIRGRAWTFGKNIDTDAIIPARHCNTADPRELAKHCMEDADRDFVKKMRRGDLIVAQNNFGCGSSREVAPITLKAAGVSAVIAGSFARIFFRNSINIGLPILECPLAVEHIAAGDELEVEPATGVIRNLTRGETYQAEPFPDFLQRIIDQGGLLAYVAERLAQKAEAA